MKFLRLSHRSDKRALLKSDDVGGQIEKALRRRCWRRNALLRRRD
jgi:hypothetical protein